MITTIINKNDDETNYQPVQQKETNKIEFFYKVLSFVNFNDI